jgi:hypothetical protein
MPILITRRGSGPVEPKTSMFNESLFITSQCDQDSNLGNNINFVLYFDTPFSGTYFLLALIYPASVIYSFHKM